MDEYPTSNVSPDPFLPDNLNRYAILAALPPEQVLDIKALAHCLSCSSRTIHRRVQYGQLPPPIHMGGQSIWVVGRIRQWISSLCDIAETIAIKEASRLSNFNFRS